MSNKGKVFTREDLPRITQQRIANKQVSEAELRTLDNWLEAQTERNRVVAVTDQGVEILAEELTERSLRYYASVGASGAPEDIDSAVLSKLRDLMTLTDDQRHAVLDAFDMDGALVCPFKTVDGGTKPKKGKK